jgi:AcrR family transcriptional regulator
MALTRQGIARTGLKVLNDTGLNGLTLRLIAQELGVKAPALYWHVKDKQELLDEIATEMMRQAHQHLPVPLGEDDERHWADWLREMGNGWRRLLLAVRDGAKVFSGTFITDPEALPAERWLTGLIAAGLQPWQAGWVLNTVYSYVIGFVIEEQAVTPVPGERDPRYNDVATELVRTLTTDDADERFRDGLDMVLLGARAWVDGAR